jgi:oligopeptide/dipeptide ABC transporter ATP-binding protein
MSNDTIVKIEDLHIEFSTPRGVVHAVDGINIEIKKGQIYGIVGESGCGKTVTGKAILQLVPSPGKIRGGQILFHGEDLVRKSEKEMQKLRGRRIAMVFQDPTAALNPLFTIGDQLMGIMKHHNIAEGDDLQYRAVEIMGDLGLPRPKDILNAYPHQLSGGMQQRAMIAMALSAKPDLIVADEPTSALDVTIQSQLLNLLDRLRNELGITIILITHDLGVVSEICDEMSTFYRGRIVEQGNVREIFHHTKHPYTKGLLAAVPNPQYLGQELKAIPGSVPINLEPIQGCCFASRCEYVMDVCHQSDPPFVALNEAHLAACYLYAEGIGNGDQ